jgi:teichoic acid transport system permease protein
MSTETEKDAETAAAAASAAASADAPAAKRPRQQREDEFFGERHVYEPHRVGLPPLRQYLKELWRRRDFAYELSRTKLRAQHFNTAFGQLWLVLNPLLLAGVYFILVDILRSGTRGPGFFAHLMACIFAYYFVSGSIRDAVKSVVSGGKLVLNTAFPRMLLPLSSVVTAFKKFLPTIIIYIPVHIATGLPVGPHLLWIFPIFALLALVAAGLSMLVAAVQVYFRDLSSFLPYALRIWLYISPILYYAEDVPEKYRPILEFNPIGPLLTAWSDVLNRGEMPHFADLAGGLAWAVVLVVGSGLFFMSRERDFAVRI